MAYETQFRITTIVIPASEAEGDAVWQAGLWAGQFVELAIGEAGYEPDELPEDAVRFADAWDYLGRQSADGHASISDEPFARAASWARGAELFDALGLTDHAALLRDFAIFCLKNEERMIELFDQDEQAALKCFRDFDDRFAALSPPSDEVQLLLRDWLLRQPWVEVDHDDGPATAERLRRSIPPHPLEQQRRISRIRSGRADTAALPLVLLRSLEAARARRLK